MPNKLIHETSPYLLQHANNPVDWHPWNEEALSLAKKINRMLIVSIGYSACHWCHVMEHECFEDPEVASLMNDHYVSVKIDREERPDLDHVYMESAYLINGSGGWPLNVICLPDGRPVYAGTYFPKGKWMQVLGYLSDLQNSQPELLENQAENLLKEMKKPLNIPDIEDPGMPAQSDIKLIHSGITHKIDFEKGGMYGAPKFPMPIVFEYLLNNYSIYGREESLQGVISSLDAMAAGGIYDQLGGGFSRYSTDADWKVPHFEKMLYDNAQLLSLYSNTYKVTNNEDYKIVIRETIDFVKRELRSPEGGFFSALDADSEGEEGRYYVWTKNEILAYGGDHAEAFCNFYRIEKDGNWEDGKNILYRTKENILPDLQNGDLASFLDIKNKLLTVRDRRERPGLDDKILTSWNAMMLIGLVDAYRALGDEQHLELALQNAHFLKTYVIREDYSLTRSFKDGVASIQGFLDDYAYLADAFIHLYQISFDESWLILADKLSAYAVEHFYDASANRFYYTSSKDPELIMRPSEMSDNVIPSSSSRMVEVLGLLGRYFDNNQYRALYEKLLKSMIPAIIKNPSFHAAWAIQLDRYMNPSHELIILGPEAMAFKKQIERNYFPGLLISGGEKRGTLSHFGYKYIEGKTMVYICRDGSCRQPTESIDKAIQQISRELEDLRNQKQ